MKELFKKLDFSQIISGTLSNLFSDTVKWVAIGSFAFLIAVGACLFSTADETQTSLPDFARRNWVAMADNDVKLNLAPDGGLRLQNLPLSDGTKLHTILLENLSEYPNFFRADIVGYGHRNVVGRVLIEFSSGNCLRIRSENVIKPIPTDGSHLLDFDLMFVYEGRNTKTSNLVASAIGG